MKRTLELFFILFFLALPMSSYFYRKKAAAPAPLQTYQLKKTDLGKVAIPVTIPKSHKNHDKIKSMLVAQASDVVRAEENRSEDEIEKEIFWKEDLAWELLRFQSDDTQLLINKIEEKNSKATVQIITLKEEHFFAAYKALIDVQTGEILSTWDQDGAPSIKSTKQKISFVPTGEIFANPDN